MPLEDETAPWVEVEEPRARNFAWLTPTIAIVAILAWTAFFVSVHYGTLVAGASGSLWTALIANWAMPVLLVIGVWLLAMRTSRREAGRFADAAATLSRESAELETRLAVVNRELSLARDFIASQSRDLESLGRVAAERLNDSAQTLQGLVAQNDERVTTIGQVSDSAVANMEQLRDQLPVLTNAARDMASQIGNAGNVAQNHLDELVEGFDRLNQYGEAADRQVEQLSGRVSETLETFYRQTAELAPMAEDRFDAMHTRSEEFRTRMAEIDQRGEAALRARAEELHKHLKERDAAISSYEEQSTAAMRDRMQVLSEENQRLLDAYEANRETALSAWSTAIETLEARLRETISKVSGLDEAAMANARTRLVEFRDEAQRVDDSIAQSAAAFDQDLGRRRNALAERETQALAELEARLDAFDRRIGDREEEHLAHVSGLAERGEELAGRLAALDDDIRKLGDQASQTGNSLTSAADSLAERLSHSRALLEENSTFIARLTDNGVRLLEIIRSGAEHADGSLSKSIGQAQERLAAFETNAVALRDLMESAESRGATLSEHVERAREGSANSLDLLGRLEEQLSGVAEKSHALAAHTRDELQQAIDMLTMSSSNVLKDLRERQGEAIRDIAGKIAGESNTAIAEALRDEAAGTISELQEAAARAGEAGRETTVQLRDQLAKVNELTSNLEQRIAQAREKAEENVDGEFSRRMALITEALNSSAIDISKAFDNEVSDTQWAQYMRGDRGVFSRRAVRLLDKQEARAIFELYEADGDFRETVNRYVHDFEAMLRQILSTRDGNVMAVTMLSSDVGKLYVALAQAIERLRD